MPFDHIDTWVFDLDNTLYNADTHAFPQMRLRMNGYISDLLGITPEAANDLRQGYYQRYGTTLRGLMNEHSVSPDDFLSYVHDFDLSPITPCAGTAQHVANLPGKRIVFTNAPRHFATRMLAHLGLDGAIDGIFAVEDAAYLPKPMPETYDLFLARHGIDGARACMVEDMEINLLPARDRGMTTVWLHGDNGIADAPHSHVQHRAARLPDFFTHTYFTKVPA